VGPEGGCLPDGDLLTNLDMLYLMYRLQSPSDLWIERQVQADLQLTREHIEAAFRVSTEMAQELLERWCRAPSPFVYG
jgi:hypothetical protein